MHDWYKYPQSVSHFKSFVAIVAELVRLSVLTQLVIDSIPVVVKKNDIFRTLKSFVVNVYSFVVNVYSFVVNVHSFVVNEFKRFQIEF